jgi:hypothetical protein
MRTKLIYLLLCTFALFSCSEKKNGETSISYSGDDILVKNFPHPTTGTSSMYGENFGSFSFDELDRYVYNFVKGSSQNIVYITLQFSEKDTYGNTSFGNKITIGSVDVADSKKFVDFNSWQSKYGTYKMWNKDRSEYNEKYLQNNQGGGFRIIPAYIPQSIK